MTSELHMINPTFSAELYYEKALDCLAHQHTTSAINYIDLAISLATDKALYLYYKIKILYSSRLYSDCMILMNEHIRFLYNHCTLEDFSELLSFYQEISEYNTNELYDILALYEVPGILAAEYNSVLENTYYDFYNKAIESQKNDNLKVCIDYCNLALREDADSIPILHLQALTYSKLGDFNKSITIFEHILDLDNDFIEIAYPLALAYIQQNDFPKAITYLKKALYASPTETDIILNLGECYSKSKHYNYAILYYERLIAINPNHIDAYLRLGELYHLTHHPLQAKKHYKLATKLQKASNTNILGDTKQSSSSPKYIILIISLSILILVSQYFLFKAGIIPSHVYDVTVAINPSEIMVNDFADFEISYNQFPSYAKDPNWVIISRQPEVADIIPNLNSLNGFAPGEAVFDILLNNKVKTSFTIQVAK